MKSNKKQLPKIDLTPEELSLVNAYRAVAADVRKELADEPIHLWHRDYLVLEQIAEELYKRMLENPHKAPVDLAEDVINEMYAEFLDATGELPDSCINSNN